MTRFDFTARRLFVRAPLSAGAPIDLDRGQANYLVNVLRLKGGDAILVFNGRDGEWTARLAGEGRKRWRLETISVVRPQPPAADLHYLFAPLKQARLDYMVQKAVEMGAGRLSPVLTRHGQVTRVNRARMAANAIEAAEQCGILSIPVIDEPVRLGQLVDGWAEHQPGRRIIFCDEAADLADPLAILAALRPSALAVLVGPEGGFSAEERESLGSRPFVTALPLGPRIVRADTAAVAALALVQAALGDWQAGAPTPH
ncbi:MAG: 16S rRNA (uracil(1498)-N(3))-methyltransferase [Bauldia sp.]